MLIDNACKIEFNNDIKFLNKQYIINSILFAFFLSIGILSPCFISNFLFNNLDKVNIYGFFHIMFLTLILTISSLITFFIIYQKCEEIKKRYLELKRDDKR